MKTILIDALHINMGGAYMILNYLITNLVLRNVNFVLLKDDRCPLLDSEKDVRQLVIMAASTRNRLKYYRNHRGNFSSVLCLGNIPPPIKLSMPVHTYIHNVNLLEIPKAYNIKNKITTWLKYKYISLLARNTDTWIVQTSHTANLVRHYLPTDNKDVHLFPFYYIPTKINRTPVSLRKDYVFIGEETGAKGMAYLISAWKNLAKKGFDKVLHITTIAPELQDLIKDAVDEGAKIENHGRIGFDEVVSLYNKSKAIVYPSLNESLGLGIIEAAEAGCDVIGSDLEYIHAICTPSCTFLPQDSDSIVEAIIRYETKTVPKTVVKIQDRVNELIDFLLI